MKKWELFVPYWGLIKGMYLLLTNKIEKLPNINEKQGAGLGFYQLIFMLILYAI